MSTNDHAPVRPEAPSHETEDTMPELTLLRKTRRVEAAIAQAAPVFERAGMGDSSALSTTPCMAPISNPATLTT